MKIMQEQHLYKITSDQGWSQMQSVLDKEMPVQDRSRRFIAYWWTGAAALAAILISVFLYSPKHKSVTPPSVSSSSVEIASREKNKPANENQSVASPSSVSAEMNVSDSNGHSKTASNPDKTKLNSASSVKTQNSVGNSNSLVIAKDSEKNNVSSQNHKIAPSVQQGNISDNDSGAGVNNVLKNTSQPQNVDEMSIASRRNQDAIAVLPLADLTDSEMNQNKKGDIGHGAYAPIVHKQSPFSPNVFAGVMIGTQNSFGSNVGVGTDYAISSRFNLTASIGYGSYQPHSWSIGNSSDMESITAEPNAIIRIDTGYTGLYSFYVKGENVNSNSDYNALNSLIHSIRQWQVSAGLKYEITSRWFVEGGAALGFGTTAISEYPIIANGGFASTADGFTASSFDGYDIIRSSMTSVYGGLGYNISRHFNLQAMWYQGLDHYLLIDQVNPNEKRTDYIRGLRLNFAYRL